jgi:hypothetical protein
MNRSQITEATVAVADSLGPSSEPSRIQSLDRPAFVAFQSAVLQLLEVLFQRPVMRVVPVGWAPGRVATRGQHPRSVFSSTSASRRSVMNM